MVHAASFLGRSKEETVLFTFQFVLQTYNIEVYDKFNRNPSSDCEGEPS